MEKFLIVTWRFLTSIDFVFTLAGGFWALIAPIHLLIYCYFFASMVEFVTWNIADYCRKREAKVKYPFDREKLVKTGWKILMVNIGIGLVWMLDVKMLVFLPGMYFADFFAAIFTIVEILNFLSNAAEISHNPVFLWARKYVAEKSKSKIDFEKYIEDEDQRKGSDPDKTV